MRLFPILLLLSCGAVKETDSDPGPSGADSAAQLSGSARLPAPRGRKNKAMRGQRRAAKRICAAASAARPQEQIHAHDMIKS